MDLQVLNLTLLYVEDDADTRKSLSELFKNKVSKLFVAEDGVEALKIFKENSIHCIISDFQMPRMNGNELCREVKKHNPQVDFILLTAYNDSDLLINAIDAGVDKFLKKPIQAEELFSTLSKISIKYADKFKLEKSTICLQEAEKIALLSYWSININNRIIEFSSEAYRLFGLDPNTPAKYIDFANIAIEEDRERFIEIFEQRVFQEANINEVIVIKTSLGRQIYLHIVTRKWVSSVCGDKHIVGIFQDVTSYETKKNELIIENLSDPILKISNKKHIIVELERLVKLSKRYDYTIGVIFFDIDNFKAINEKYGHIVADDLLVELSELIKKDIRESDLFGRWGGDEFVLISGYSSAESTILLAEKISKKINSNLWKCKINLTISMGLSFYEESDDSYSLLERADSKMLEAKHSGKNRYHY